MQVHAGKCTPSLSKVPFHYNSNITEGGKVQRFGKQVAQQHINRKQIIKKRKMGKSVSNTRRGKQTITPLTCCQHLESGPCTSQWPLCIEGFQHLQGTDRNTVVHLFSSLLDVGIRQTTGTNNFSRFEFVLKLPTTGACGWKLGGTRDRLTASQPQVE